MPRLRLHRAGSSSFVVGPRQKNTAQPQFLPDELGWAQNMVLEANAEDDQDEVAGDQPDLLDACSVFDFPQSQSQHRRRDNRTDGDAGTLTNLSSGEEEAEDDGFEEVWWRRHRLSQMRSKSEQDAINQEVQQNITRMLKELGKIRLAHRRRQTERAQMPPPSLAQPVVTRPCKESRHQTSYQPSSSTTRGNDLAAAAARSTNNNTNDVTDSPLPFSLSQYRHHVEQYSRRLPKPVAHRRRNPLNTNNTDSSEPNSAVGSSRKDAVPRKAKALRQKQKPVLEGLPQGMAPPEISQITSKRRRRASKKNTVTSTAAERPAADLNKELQFSEESLNAYADSCPASRHSSRGKSQPSTPSARIVPSFGKPQHTPGGARFSGGNTPRTLGMVRQKTTPAASKDPRTCRTANHPTKQPTELAPATNMVTPVLGTAATPTAVPLLAIVESVGMTTQVTAVPATVPRVIPNLFSPSPRLTVGNECELPYTQTDASQVSDISNTNIFCQAVMDDTEDEESTGASQEPGAMQKPAHPNGSSSPNVENAAADHRAFHSSSQAWISGEESAILSQSSQSQSSQSSKFKIPYRRESLQAEE
ncbi:uncharacterized protein LOC135810358 [Sycon ciliatum]|uniref:uncharacterized protein LOC135810358 n=1 Tax=Sycon ciliatum TaxID=27933 RepID=UPI0031F65487